MREAVLQAATTAEMLALGARLGQALRASACRELVVELRGRLGAGKTVFVRGLARALGVPASVPVVSPTFTIARAYAVSAGAIAELHHVDAYRLSGAEEAEAVGFEEMCGEGRLTCVEWGEMIEDALPPDRLRLTLVPSMPARLDPGEVPECPRAVRCEALGPRAAGVLARWLAAADASA